VEAFSVSSHPEPPSITGFFVWLALQAQRIPPVLWFAVLFLDLISIYIEYSPR